MEPKPQEAKPWTPVEWTAIQLYAASAKSGPHAGLLNRVTCAARLRELALQSEIQGVKP